MVDLSWTNEAESGWGKPGGTTSDAAWGTVHKARVTDKMLSMRGGGGGGDLGGGGAGMGLGAGAGAGVAGVGAKAKTAAMLEQQWDKRLRRKGAGRKEREKTLLELVTERRERSARAAERHRAVRAHIKQRREEKDAAAAAAASVVSSDGRTGVGVGEGVISGELHHRNNTVDGGGVIAGRGATRRRNWMPGDLVEDVNATQGVVTLDPGEVEVHGDNQMFCTVVKKK